MRRRKERITPRGVCTLYLPPSSTSVPRACNVHRGFERVVRQARSMDGPSLARVTTNHGLPLHHTISQGRLAEP